MEGLVTSPFFICINGTIGRYFSSIYFFNVMVCPYCFDSSMYFDTESNAPVARSGPKNESLGVGSTYVLAGGRSPDRRVRTTTTSMKKWRSERHSRSTKSGLLYINDF